jgi:hypothetical protein
VRQPSFSGDPQNTGSRFVTARILLQPPTPSLSYKHLNMIQICRAEDGEVFQVCLSYITCYIAYPESRLMPHFGTSKGTRLRVMAPGHQLNVLQTWKPQGDWDRRERCTGVSLRRTEVKNGQCTGSRGGTRPGASSNSAMLSHPYLCIIPYCAYGLRVRLSSFSHHTFSRCLLV